MIPTKEKGASLLRSFRRQSGNKTMEVTPNKLWVRLTLTPMEAMRLTTVSAKIMEYERFPAAQSTKQLRAMIQLVEVPTEASQASL